MHVHVHVHMYTCMYAYVYSITHTVISCSQLNPSVYSIRYDHCHRSIPSRPHVSPAQNGRVQFGTAQGQADRLQARLRVTGEGGWEEEEEVRLDVLYIHVVGGGLEGEEREIGMRREVNRWNEGKGES